jgi:Lar family restriction alleviation protein
MRRLKPCPFCGAKAKVSEYGFGYRVVCSNFLTSCVAQGPYRKTPEEAEETWNRRPKPGKGK